MAKRRLGDVCTVVTGSTPKTNIDEYWDGSIKWITPAELTEDTCILEDSVRKITDLAVIKTGLSSFPKGTVILSSRAPIGKVAIAGCEMYCNQGFKNLICSDEIYNEYLFWFLRGKTEFLNSLGRGATFKEISKSIVENIEIELPAIEIQKEIAQKLRKCSEIITLRKGELLELDNLIKSRFVEMFGTLKDNNGRFDIVTIEEVCSLIKDGTHQTPEYTEDVVNGFKFLSSKDVMSQKIDWTDIRYIPVELHEKLYSTIQPKRNDILMSKNGVNYGVAAVNDTDEVFDIYVSLALLRPMEVINPVYFRCAINNPDTKRQFDSSIKGIGVPNLHLGEIKKTKIILPPLSMQNEFENFVIQVDKLKFFTNRQIEITYKGVNRFGN